MQKEILACSLPDFAPLPFPFVQHLLATLNLTPQELQRQVRSFRHSISTFMEPYVRIQVEQRYPENQSKGKSDPGQEDLGITTGWLMKAITANSPGKRRIPLQTISSWHKRGLLRYRQWGLPDFSSAAALLIMRMLHSHIRGWLPSTMDTQEPHWWCWRQDTPDAPVIPCPYPLPDDLPASTLLWTPWPGAAWEPAWVSVGAWGAIRLAGFPGRGTGQATFTRDILSQWDAELAAFYEPLPSFFGLSDQRVNSTMLYSLATVVVLRLARGRLFPKDVSSLT
ncbi:MAG: hypothetical protein WCD86_19490 [Ktedonobacteraceae bacterium]